MLRTPAPTDPARAASAPDLLAWACAIGCCAALTALFAPGFMSPDSVWQLDMARHGDVSDWHPPMMAVLWRALDAVAPGPIGLLVLQNAILFGGLALLVCARARPSWRAPLVLAAALHPPVWGLLSTVWKDVLLGATLLLAAALLVRAERASARPSRAALPLLFLALALRYNALFAVAPLCFWWARLVVHAQPGLALLPQPLAGPGRLGALATAALLCASLGVNRALTDQRSFPEQQVWLHDLTGISLGVGRVLFPAYLVDRDPPATLEALARLYQPGLADSITLGPLHPLTADARNRGALFRAWLGAIARHPLLYLEHRLGLAALLWGTAPRTPETPYHWGVIPNQLGVRFSETPLSEAAHRLLERAAGTPLFAGWPIAAVLALGLWLGWRRRLPGLACLAASGLSYQLSNVFLAPVTDFRYQWWSHLAALAVLLLAATPGADRAQGVITRMVPSPDSAT